MTITYLDEKPGVQQTGAETNVPALAAGMVAEPLMPVMPVAEPVFSEKSVRMLLPEMPKRGRGRPAKNKLVAPAPIKRGRGRPPKNKLETVVPVKRGRGRPKANPGPGRPAKLKRGRPAKSETDIRLKRKQLTKKAKTTMTTTISSENRRGRKSEGKTCKLVCLITGTTRTAGSGYLSSKPVEFRSNYISRPALKLLRQGLTVQQVRQQLQQGMELAEPSSEALQSAIAINGKHKKQ